MPSHVDPDRTLGFALKRVQQVLRNRMDARLAAYRLTSPQYAVLALLAEHPGISNAELARRSFVTPPTMIRMIATLTDEGVITRDERTAAARTRPIALTPAGRKRLAVASSDVQDLEDILLRTAGSDAQTILTWLRSTAELLEANPV
jgi:DNA-binding MarR family transcriptional regulator